jgi:hypothetical protein
MTSKRKVPQASWSDDRRYRAGVMRARVLEIIAEFEAEPGLEPAESLIRLDRYFDAVIEDLPEQIKYARDNDDA